MRGIFITYGIPSSEDNSGVGLKIRNQIKILNQFGLECSEITLPIRKKPLLRLLYRLPFYNGYPIWKYTKVFKKVDYIYMRRPFVMTGFMRKVLYQVHTQNPQVKILLEIPTFPYDMEISHFKCSFPLLLRDRYNRKKLQGLVDRIVTVTNDKKIFGIPTIQMKNGIIVDEIVPRVATIKNNNEIHLCAVALFKEWHGYERLLLGLSDYYSNGGNRKILLHFVGYGQEESLYKKIVYEKNLGEFVYFHGYLKGEELDNIYNISDIGICSLASHRKGIEISSELKSREYIAKGLPIVSSTPIDIIVQKEFPYCLYVPANESNIQINRLIAFHDRVYRNNNEATVIKSIRKYAYEMVDMQQTMKPIVNYIKSSL